MDLLSTEHLDRHSGMTRLFTKSNAEKGENRIRTLLILAALISHAEK